MSSIKQTVIIIVSSICIIVGIELALNNIFGYGEVVLGSTSCKIFEEKKGYSYYKSDCQLSYKNWEQSETILYKINSQGRRDLASRSPRGLIAFFGDSFTFGAMVDIADSYVFRSLYYLDKFNIGGHNYGVSGEQFHNIYEKLKTFDPSPYDLIVYGITPNDLFDMVDGSAGGAREMHVDGASPDTPISYFRKMRAFLLSTSISRALLKTFLGVDEIFHETYMSRRPYAGYLESPVSEAFKSSIYKSMDQLGRLSDPLKSKLVVFLLPQRAEVVASRLGYPASGFQEIFVKACVEEGFICGTSDIAKLARLPKSHFVVDGHLTASGNDSVGLDLSLLLSDVISHRQGKL